VLATFLIRLKKANIYIFPTKSGHPFRGNPTGIGEAEDQKA
jgi:hypothetical protein